MNNNPYIKRQGGFIIPDYNYKGFKEEPHARYPYFVGGMINKGVNTLGSVVGTVGSSFMKDPNKAAKFKEGAEHVGQIVGSTAGIVGDALTGNVPGIVSNSADLVGDVGSAMQEYGNEDVAKAGEVMGQVGSVGSAVSNFIPGNAMSDSMKMTGSMGGPYRRNFAMGGPTGDDDEYLKYALKRRKFDELYNEASPKQLQALEIMKNAASTGALPEGRNTYVLDASRSLPEQLEEAAAQDSIPVVYPGGTKSQYQWLKEFYRQNPDEKGSSEYPCATGVCTADVAAGLRDVVTPGTYSLSSKTNPETGWVDLNVGESPLFGVDPTGATLNWTDAHVVRGGEPVYDENNNLLGFKNYYDTQASRKINRPTGYSEFLFGQVEGQQNPETNLYDFNSSGYTLDDKDLRVSTYLGEAAPLYKELSEMYNPDFETRYQEQKKFREAGYPRQEARPATFLPTSVTPIDPFKVQKEAAESLDKAAARVSKNINNTMRQPIRNKLAEGGPTDPPVKVKITGRGFEKTEADPFVEGQYLTTEDYIDMSPQDFKILQQYKELNDIVRPMLYNDLKYQLRQKGIDVPNTASFDDISRIAVENNVSLKEAEGRKYLENIVDASGNPKYPGVYDNWLQLQSQVHQMAGNYGLPLLSTSGKTENAANDAEAGNILTGGRDVSRYFDYELFKEPSEPYQGTGQQATAYGEINTDVDSIVAKNQGRTTPLVSAGQQFGTFTPVDPNQPQDSNAEFEVVDQLQGYSRGKRQSDTQREIYQADQERLQNQPMPGGESDPNNRNAYGGVLKRYGLGGNMPLSEVNAGGTHEENPLGGVPISDEASVEQGETIINNNFVFSNRIKVPGKKYTFADKSKKIEKKYSARKYDSIDDAQREQELNKLAYEQEMLKEKEAAKAASKLQELGYGNTMAYGGLLKKMGYGGKMKPDGGPVGSHYTFKANEPQQTAWGYANQAFSPIQVTPELDMPGRAVPQEMFHQRGFTGTINPETGRMEGSPYRNPNPGFHFGYGGKVKPKNNPPDNDSPNDNAPYAEPFGPKGNSKYYDRWDSMLASGPWTEDAINTMAGYPPSLEEEFVLPPSPAPAAVQLQGMRLPDGPINEEKAIQYLNDRRYSNPLRDDDVYDHLKYKLNVTDEDFMDKMNEDKKERYGGYKGLSSKLAVANKERFKFGGKIKYFNGGKMNYAPGGEIPIPTDPNELKAFQDWVNTQAGEDITGGYGMGPLTQAAWDTYGDMYRTKDLPTPERVSPIARPKVSPIDPGVDVDPNMSPFDPSVFKAFLGDSTGPDASANTKKYDTKNSKGTSSQAEDYFIQDDRSKLGAAMSLAPIGANLMMGMQKPYEFDAERFSLDTPSKLEAPKMNIDPALRGISQASNRAADTVRNTGAGAGNIMANMQGLANRESENIARTVTTAANQDAMNQMRADQFNIGNEMSADARNKALALQGEDMNLRSKAARNAFLQQAASQAGQIGQNIQEGEMYIAASNAANRDMQVDPGFANPFKRKGNRYGGYYRKK